MALLSVDEACEKLQNQDVVALPTETVYGLAGCIDSETALKKIFAVKARPFFDPLIVHVFNLEQAQNLARWDSVSIALADHFWPGPLTLVLPKKDVVSGLITSGGHTVAIRQPDHRIFQNILGRLGTPLAAPSANRFGHTSPTSAQHVIDEFQNQVDVVDGGECAQGIESTVVEWDVRDKALKILRPGMITAKVLRDFLITVDPALTVVSAQQNNAPGHLQNHYQPTVPLALIKNFNGDTLLPAVLEQLHSQMGRTFAEWKLHSQSSIAARQLYKDLRDFSKKDQAIYLVIQKSWEKDEHWQSIMDRLNKAAHLFVEWTGSQWNIQTKNNSLQ